MSPYREAITLTFFFLCITPLIMTQFVQATTSSPTPEPTPKQVPTASLLWQFTVPNPASNEYNVNSWTPPEIGKGSVYVGMSGTRVYNKVSHYTPEGPWDSGIYTEKTMESWGGTFALNVSSGLLLWYREQNSSLWSSPTVINGNVLTQTGERELSALNASNGYMIWSYTTDADIGAFSVSDRAVSIGCGNGNIYALNISNGYRLWTFGTNSTPFYYKWGNSVGNAFPIPIIVDNVVYVSSANGYVYALNNTSGSMLWSYSAGVPIWLAHSVSNGEVFFDSAFGDVCALNATNGNKIWNNTLDNFGLLGVCTEILFVTYNKVTGYENGGNYSGVTYSGNICALDASNGKKLWNNTLGGVGYFFDSNSPPSIIDGIAYVGSFDHNLYALNSSTGSIIWKIPIKGNLLSSPSVVDNSILFFTRQDENIYASKLPNDPPPPSHIPTVTFEQEIQFPYQLPIFALAILIVLVAFFLFSKRSAKSRINQN